jgi:hypothetical protein
MQFDGISEVGGSSAFLRHPCVGPCIELFQLRNCPLSVTPEITCILKSTAGGRYGDEFRPD